MKGWRTYKLAELCEDISYGYTESATQENIGPKFLRITDIQNYFINWSTVPYCPITKENHVRYKLEVGDIVIARTGATTGVTSIFKDSNVDAVYASYLIRYKINKKVADPFYIGHLLKSQLWQSHVGSIIGGSAQPGANAKQFGAFEFQLPELKTQSQITSILSSLDNKIELNLQMNQTLEAMAQAIFKEWFVDFKFPGSTKKLVNGLPKGWRKEKLEEVLNIKYGKDHKHLADGNIPVYGSGGVMRFVDESLYEKNSILIPRKGTLSNLFYISKPFWAVDTMFYTQIKHEHLGKYLFHLLQTLDLASMNVGSAVPSLTTQVLNNLVVIIPTDEIAEQFEDLVTSFFKRMDANNSENESLTQIRDSLLPNLMNGTIAVNA